MSANRYPNLSLLLSAYLHQDWMLDVPTPEDAVRDFAVSEPPEVVRGAHDELTVLLEQRLGEDELAKIVLDELGSYYDPRGVGRTLGSWLDSVRKQLKSPTV